MSRSSANSAASRVMRYSQAPKPNASAIEVLNEPGTLFVSGRFVGAGKDTIIRALGEQGYRNVPTWVTRELRPDEQEGIHKCHVDLEQIADACDNGDVLEVEQLSSGNFYATVASEFAKARACGGSGAIKDLEWGGIRNLRRMNPGLRVVVPLANIDDNTRAGITPWEERLVLRHDWHRAITAHDIADLGERLAAAVEAVDMLIEDDAINDPNVLIVINDSVPKMIARVLEFARHGARYHDLARIQKHLRTKRQMAVSAASMLDNIA